MSDSRDLAHIEPGAVPVRQSDNLLAQVIAAAKDPQVDANKMETLARLVNTQQDREREIEFNRDLNAAIMEMPVITRSGEIIIPANSSKGTAERKQGKFARFEDIDRVCRPILASHNLAIRFEIGTEDGQTGAITVRPIISHANGFTERGEAMRVPADTSGSKNAAQAVGSSSQYGKRYAYCAALNIVTEGVDDDGRGGQLAVTLPYEREQLVLADAQKAFDEGRYLEWYAQQPPKDRGWLNTSGKHVEFGGQPMLTNRAAPEPRTAARREEAPPPPPPPPPPPQEAEDGPTSQTERRTPLQMVEDFEKRLDEAETGKAVIELQAEPRVAKWMDNLKARHAELFDRVTDYAAKRYSSLAAAEREKARTAGEKLL